jgi:hypothetical protein
VSRGELLTIRNFSVQNLSSGLSQSNPLFRVYMINQSTGVSYEIGWFSWGSFCAFCNWSGSLSYRVPSNVPSGSYWVRADYQGFDSDSSNNQAWFRVVNVR